MIEKLKEHDVIDPKTDKVIGKIGCDLREIMDKLNEVIDAVNALIKENNIHKMQIDELQMKAEPVKPDDDIIYKGE